jgi:hypothetical protein
MAVARDVKKRQERCIGVLLGNSEGQRPLGRPGNRMEKNIAIGLQEVAWGGTELIDLDQDRDKG